MSPKITDGDAHIHILRISIPNFSQFSLVTLVSSKAVSIQCVSTQFTAHVSGIMVEYTCTILPLHLKLGGNRRWDYSALRSTIG